MPTPAKHPATPLPAKRVDWPGDAEQLAPGHYAQYPVDAMQPPPVDLDAWPEEARKLWRAKRHHLAGRWFARTPNGLLVNLSNHDVVEHGDGTISVAPVIIVGTERDGNHHGWIGSLERGEWREQAAPTAPTVTEG